MIDRARSNTAQLGHKNVEFRLGEIENLLVAYNAIDAVISNCVINLSPNKRRVFEEAFRALKPQSRLMISDIVLSKRLPAAMRRSVDVEFTPDRLSSLFRSSFSSLASSAVERPESYPPLWRGALTLNVCSSAPSECLIGPVN